MDLQGKTAIVTGASSGIGAATVRKLREAGARVVGGARRVERIDADLALPLDVTDEESCAAFVGRATSELGGLDILYNNAGLALGRYPFDESTEEDEATVIHTNLDGALRMTRLCLPHIRDGGHILFTGSVAGRQAYENAASYVAAKFGVRGFVYGLREDLLGRDIRITTVDAGPDRDRVLARALQGRRRARERRLPGRRAADPGGRRRLRPLRPHPSPARERRRDRRQGARPVERRPHPAQHVAMLTVLEGSTFCISDERGDIAAETAGLFAYDTRFLSRLVLRIDGERPLLLSSGRVGHYAAAFYLRNPAVNGLPSDSLSVARERFVGTGLQEKITVRNETMERLQFGAHARSRRGLRGHHLGEAVRLLARRPAARARVAAARARNPRGGARADRGSRGRPAHARRRSPSRSSSTTGELVFRLDLDPHEHWTVSLDVLPALDHDAIAEDLDDERETRADVAAAWNLRVPRVRGGWESLRRAFDRSIDDLGALRMRAGYNRHPLFAAGMPWFMTVFGRDTAITSLQTLLLGPELATGALEALAELQATEEDPEVDAEPGKIVHEVREGRAADTWFSRYYGSIDSTPLFLVLLSETWRWTDDSALATRLHEPALRALEWIDRYGDDRRRRLRRVPAPRGRRSREPVVEGLRRLAAFPRRALGGAADRAGRGAGLRVRGEARHWRRSRARCGASAISRSGSSGRRPSSGSVSRRRSGCPSAAASTRSRSTARSGRWMRSARTSGHLLWSGIVSPERVPAVVDQLLGESMWSGWGIRTMSSADAAYSPLSYHNGTVWPHDTALAAWGLARHGYVEPARRVARGLIEAAGHFDWSLPEVFAGYARDETPFPIAYPTAARPQAWAAGTPILLVRVLLGIEPDRPRERLVSTVEDELPSWLEGLRVEAVRAFGRTWSVSVERGRVTISEGV